MHNLVTMNVSESTAMQVIFNACKANEDRISQTIECRGETYGVVFARHATGTEFQAVMRNDDGIVIALATIDEYDI